MTQKGLIKRVLETLGLDVGTPNGKFTPAKGKPLVKHVQQEPASGDFNYNSVVGMLWYLAGHTRPHITYVVNCPARYMFCPRLVHKHALKQIGYYLKTTPGKGLVMKPSEKLLKIDSFPDADFAGMHRHKVMGDPVCVESRTGYMIMVANCPFMWQSKLQTETALSTMEAKSFALAHSCCEIINSYNGLKQYHGYSKFK